MAPFTFDAYRGWSEERLKLRCRQLCRAVDRKDLMIAMFVEYGPNWHTEMPEEFRKEAKRINKARRNDPSDYQQGVKHKEQQEDVMPSCRRSCFRSELGERDRLQELVAALTEIAAFGDEGAEAHLKATGSYGRFDEPGAVKIARNILEKE